MSRPTRRKSGSATIQDVAREAGVSAMTVSRVVNGGSQVRSETREAVLAAIEKLSYQPNSAARTLAAGRAAQIGLLYSNPSASYLSQFLIGALEGARLGGSHLLLQPCNVASPTAQAEAARHFVGPDIQGVILPPPLSESEAVKAELTAAHVPWVAIALGRMQPGALNVRIDDQAAAATMTRHLLELGHRRIGFIKGHPNQIASAERYRGFVAALADAGLVAKAMPVEQGYFSYDSGLEAAGRMLAGADRPTAIFASNDDMAAAAVGVANRLGLKVPQDLSIVGFDDTQLATSIWPQLTTIRQPIAEMARSAVALLQERLRTGETPDEPERVLPYQLIVRGSSGPPTA
jgi:LacI family transcriptional regulator